MALIIVTPNKIPINNEMDKVTAKNVVTMALTILLNFRYRHIKNIPTGANITNITMVNQSCL